MKRWQAIGEPDSDLLQEVMESTGTQLAYLDLEFNFIRVNRAYAQGSGHTKEELIGRNHFALFPNAENQAIFERVRDTGEPVTFVAKPFEYPDQPQRGVTYWDWTLTPLKDAAGRVQGLVLSLLDVTKRERATEALRTNEERFRFVLANSPVVVATLDRQLHYTWIYNPVAGFKPEQVVGEAVGMSLTPDAREKMLASLRLVLSEGASARWELESHTDSGDRVFESYAEPLKDSSGHVTGVALISVDITDRKRAEAELESAARFPAENPDPVLRIGGDGLLLYANDASYSLLPDWALEVGKPAPAALGQGASRAVEEETSMMLELEYGRRIFSFGVVPIVRAGYANLYGRDITERRRVESALRLTEQRAQDLIRYAPTAIYEIDFRGPRFMSVNDAMCQMSGYTRDELLAMSPFDLLSPESRALFQTRIHQVLSGMKVDELVEYSVRTKDGRELHAILNTTPIIEDGRPIGAFVIAHDITARKQAEKERAELLAREQAARLAAETAVQVRDQFITLASHELKTPLTSLRGYAELLLRRSRDLGAEDARMVQTIHQQILRLEKMIYALLDITRVERGQLGLERVPVDLGALLTGLVRNLLPTLRVHRLELVTPNDPVIVEGDEARLEQVLENLIQNAVKYSPRGGSVWVRLTVAGAAACIAVSDEGIGIPPTALPQLFTRFYRAENAEGYHISGLGIGLYIAKEIVHLHGGEIEVESVEGQGSTFTVRLPVQKATRESPDS